MDLIGALAGAAGAAGEAGNPNAWDISKAYYAGWDISQSTYETSLSISAKETNPSSIFFKPDGTKFYICGFTSDSVHEYNCSTAWSISSGTFSQSFSVSSQDDTPTGIFFKPDGTKMYVCGFTGQDVNEYSLSTAWNISTASYVRNFSVSGQTAQPYGIFFKSDGTKMYVVGTDNTTVNEYSLSTAWDISSASYVQNISVNTEEGSPRGIFFKTDGTKLYISGDAGDEINEYDLSTAWDISTASYLQNFSIGAKDTAPTGIFFKPDGDAFYFIGRTGDSIYQYTIGSFSVAAQDTAPLGIFFKDDGTKMYILGSVGDDVNEYDLSTAWDITTSSYSQLKSISAQDNVPTDLFFKPDGLKMFMVGQQNDRVNEYSLSVAWDVSTLSYVQNFSITSQENAPNGIFFKPDGTKLYVTGATNDTVYQYSLSTAWDISSASYDSVSFSVSAQETTPQGISFKPDGTKMYITGGGGDDVNEYDLSTPWDVSSASYVQNFPVFDTNPTGLYWRDNGEEFFIVGSSLDRVTKYTISST